MTSPSLAYRTAEAAIWNGRAPVKYTRLLPHISGLSLLEMGAAEGVLSLLLADRDPSARVTALEFRQGRHDTAVALQRRWQALGKRVSGCAMVCADLRDRLDLLDGVDTFIAIRAIYYLRETIDETFDAIAAKVPRVVLSGNPGRALRYKQANGTPKDNLGKFNFYASVEGMRAVLERHGYQIDTVVTEGDPIVTGHR